MDTQCLIAYVNDLFSVNIIENNCNITNWECLSAKYLTMTHSPDDISVKH